MTELTKWKDALVLQKDHRLGAIAAGFEWMIRFNKIKDVNFETFQDDFNLQVNGEGKNDLLFTAEAVKKIYPHISIKCQSFSTGKEKVAFIKELVSKNVPSMLSLTLSSKSNVSHEMPVTFYDENYVRLVWRVGDTKNPDMLRIAYDDILIRHRDWAGGKEIAWLEPLS